MTQPSSQEPTATGPHQVPNATGPSQDPTVTGPLPDPFPAPVVGLPVPVQPTVLAPTPTVLPASNINSTTASAPTTTPAAPGQHFVTCSDLSASIGKLCQFFQDKIAKAFHKVAGAIHHPQLGVSSNPPQAMDGPLALLDPAFPACFGEYQSAITYPWLSLDLINKVHQDTLDIYNLPKRANPSWPGAPAQEDPAPVIIEGFWLSRHLPPLPLTASSLKRCPMSWDQMRRKQEELKPVTVHPQARVPHLWQPTPIKDLLSHGSTHWAFDQSKQHQPIPPHQPSPLANLHWLFVPSQEAPAAPHGPSPSQRRVLPYPSPAESQLVALVSRSRSATLLLPLPPILPACHQLTLQ
ncbi:hypothetical protein NDA10_005755 [Ustilago hordei]|nr:hypothetical protein NDA10_005755 [Ustilago hordei]